MTSERRSKILRRLRRGLKWSAVALLVLLIAVELIGRFGLGLCDPALLDADPDMEYVFRPSQHTRQFGHDVIFNRYSMRTAEDFPKTKASPEEFRVLVLGDSIVFGGTQVDQQDLATSRLRESLHAKLKRPVIVGNVGAGSWGPGNLLAYTKKHGFFDADVVVVVISSHDVADVMSFAPLVGRDPSYPDRKPRLALWEIATRYGPRFFAIRRQAAAGPASPPPAAATTEPAHLVDQAMSALRELLTNARATGARVIVAQHWEQPELDGSMMFGHGVIRATAESCEGVEVVQLGPAFKAARDRGEQPYRDYIHPSPVGQGVLARVLEDVILNPP